MQESNSGGKLAKRSFDAAGFFAALDAQRRSTKKTWKQVAGEAGLSASTLTRLAQGHRPDIDWRACFPGPDSTPKPSFATPRTKAADNRKR